MHEEEHHKGHLGAGDGQRDYGVPEKREPGRDVPLAKIDERHPYSEAQLRATVAREFSTRNGRRTSIPCARVLTPIFHTSAGNSTPNGGRLSIVQTSGAFMMPIGPVYSDVAESAHFLLETVGEDVIRTIRRFFYKYRGVEKISEGRSVDQVILLSERFSGTSAFAHSLAFCQAVEDIAGADPPPWARALRIILAELERLRHHIAAIAGICGSTALSVATAQAGILQEEALRITGSLPDTVIFTA